MRLTAKSLLVLCHLLVFVTSTSIFPSVPLMLAFQSSLQPACLLPSASVLPGYDTLCPVLELACVTSESSHIAVGVPSPFIQTFCPRVFIFFACYWVQHKEKGGGYSVRMSVTQTDLIKSLKCAACGDYWPSGEQGVYRNTGNGNVRLKLWPFQRSILNFFFFLKSSNQLDKHSPKRNSNKQNRK